MWKCFNFFDYFLYFFYSKLPTSPNRNLSNNPLKYWQSIPTLSMIITPVPCIQQYIESLTQQSPPSIPFPISINNFLITRLINNIPETSKFVYNSCSVIDFSLSNATTPLSPMMLPLSRFNVDLNNVITVLSIPSKNRQNHSLTTPLSAILLLSFYLSWIILRLLLHT